MAIISELHSCRAEIVVVRVEDIDRLFIRVGVEERRIEEEEKNDGVPWSISSTSSSTRWSTTQYFDFRVL